MAYCFRNCKGSAQIKLADMGFVKKILFLPLTNYTPMSVTEDILHFAWQYRLYQPGQLATADGEKLVVLGVGRHNTDAGPDFLEARLRIGDTEWVGSVELHIHSSDWPKHRHQHDKAYNNVVLHVVYEHDGDVQRADGTVPPTLALRPILIPGVLQRYRELMSGMYWIPCERQLGEVPRIKVDHWLDRMLVERLESRMGQVLALLDECQGSWEEAAYRWLARGFGFKVNADPFERLARNVPLALFEKHRADRILVDALYFGQAGLLDGESADGMYPRQLAEEYRYLQKLHGLVPMEGSQWRFLRMRPANFPTQRIAQFAALLLQRGRLFADLLAVSDVREIREWFADLPVHPYWQEHYRFGGRPARHSGQLGNDSVSLLLINVVAVILFCYGKYMGKEAYIYRAIALLEGIQPEKNALLQRFAGLGVHASAASASQALLHMKKSYCDRKRCLDCSIGTHIIKQKKEI